MLAHQSAGRNERLCEKVTMNDDARTLGCKRVQCRMSRSDGGCTKSGSQVEVGEHHAPRPLSLGAIPGGIRELSFELLGKAFTPRPARLA